MKKLLPWALLLLLTLLLTASACAEVTLRLSEVQAADYPTGLADQEFARLVEEKTQGRVKVDCHFSGTLYDKEAAAVEALQDGEIAFARVSAAPVGSFVPEINALILPYLYKSSAHMWAVLKGEIGLKVLNDIEASGRGIIGLCWYDGGSRCFYSTAPLYQASDLAGKKFSMPDNPLMLDMVKTLGAQGVSGIGGNEVFSALQTGAIDGAENNIPTYQNMGDYEAAPYYLLDHHTRMPEVLLASASVPKLVSPEDWAIIRQCAVEVQDFQIEEYRKKEEASYQILRDAGVELIEMTPLSLVEIQYMMKPIYLKYAFDYIDLVSEIQSIGEAYENE